MKNTTKNPLVFVTKYNNQTKVNEILAHPYEGQRMQTDIFPEAPIVSYNIDIIGQFEAPNRRVMIEEPKEVLTFYLNVSMIDFFVNREYESFLSFLCLLHKILAI